MLNIKTQKERVHIDDKNSTTILNQILLNLLLKLNCSPSRKLIILCVGTDRSTGDALGPLTGTMLKKTRISEFVKIMGDIQNPVHASNLNSIITNINNSYINPFVIAVDAGLGKESSVGYVNVKKGPLKPGTGVNKTLPEVGDMHITGLVNISGYMEYMVLQSTRLSFVMKMSEIITSALKMSVIKFYESINTKNINTVKL